MADKRTGVDPELEEVWGDGTTTQEAAQYLNRVLSAGDGVPEFSSSRSKPRVWFLRKPVLVCGTVALIMVIFYPRSSPHVPSPEQVAIASLDDVMELVDDDFDPLPDDAWDIIEEDVV
jgi:hypothetical protein